VVICLWRGADLHMAQLIPLPVTVSCFSKIQIGFTFLVLATWVVLDSGQSPESDKMVVVVNPPVLNYRVPVNTRIMAAAAAVVSSSLSS